MANIALITAKGGNQSLPNKNLIRIEGKSFLGWQISSAKLSTNINEVFVSTECPMIAEEALKYDARIINRPKELALPNSNHGDVILHGAREAKNQLNKEIDIIVILLGNTICVRPDDIDNTVSILQRNLHATSCMTVWQAQDDHPFRAMKIDANGYLKSFHNDNDVDTNRQSYPDVYFYDQGPWAVRYSVLFETQRGVTGPACWWWMGDKCIPVIRNWVTGRDIHTQLDVEVSKLWLNNRLWEI